MASYPISTRAIVTTPPKEGPQLQWSLQSVKLREPADGEILVRIVATGVCHTDLVMSMMPPEIGSYPKILGHEGAGVVERIGSGVSHVKTGDLVLISFDYCNESGCLNCSQGTPSYCPQFLQYNIVPKPDVVETETGEKAGGFYFGQSSFSGLALVKEKSALNVTGVVTEEDLKWLAPLGCGFMTGAGSVTELANVSDVDKVAVTGLGGVGMSAIMAAKIRGAQTIIAVDRIQSRLDIAKSIGATHTINTSDFSNLKDDLVKAIEEIQPGGTTVNFDTTGVLDIVRACVLSLHPRGQAILIGIMSGLTLDLDLTDFLSKGKQIRASIEGSAKPDKYIPQLLQWHKEGKLPVEKLIKHYPVEDFEKALVDMHSGATIKPILLW